MVKKESILGIKKGDSFILQNIVSGNKQVSGGSSIGDAYLEINIFKS